MPRRIWLLWVLFIARGCFYCAMLPLWEGWDEYAHFAWLDHWLLHGTLPRQDDPIAREIDESMRLAPLPHELAWIGPPYLTHEQWWALPETERQVRRHDLAALPPQLAREVSQHKFVFYEAQQPPLYYWLVSIPLRFLESRALTSRVLAMRLIGLLLASLAVPLTWLAAKQVVGKDAVLCAGMLAVAPGFAIDASRVANDCLAIAVMSFLLWLLLRDDRKPIGTGLALGAGLLTKAIFVPIIPAFIVLWWRQERRLLAGLAIAFLLSGWWYARNLVLGYSLTGWIIQAGPAPVTSGVLHINWLSAANVAATSLTWFGAWSFLTLKSWMYRLVEAIALAGAVLAVRRRGLQTPATLSGFFVVAMMYGTVLTQASGHAPNVPGWYLWPLGGALAIILAAGLRRYSIVLIAVLTAIDLYGVIALLSPFYAGLAERNKAAGGQFFGALTRLQVPVWLAVLWAAATIAIPLICWRDSGEQV